MFLTDKKLEARANELKEYRYRDVIPFDSLLMCEDEQKIVNPIVPTDFTGWDEMHVGDNWSGRDRYLWLHKEIEIPASWSGRRVLGIFDYGNTGAGNNSGFESLLYVNGHPFQGVDLNHKEAFFKEEMIGKKADLTFRLWSGLEGGGVPTAQEHKCSRADLAWLDEKTDDLYYMSMMIADTLKNLDETNPIRYQLRKALDSAMMLIDWGTPGSEEFYASIAKADDCLNDAIDHMDKDSMITVKCVGHSHIDVAWLWRLKHTREKCSRSFSTVIRLMEQYPEYIFLQTQPQLYEYIKNDFPEIYEKIQEKVKAGQWEVDGGMWVEADCNLTSGESLTRQILIGSRFIKEEFNKDVEYLWLPDVFGYSWALPQILKKSGIDMFMTTKISWNQYNRMPHDTFKWIGMDGSEVLTHFITTPDPWSTPGSWFYTYNGQLTPKTVKGVWDAYSEKDMNQELLICYGYGDGGGGVNRDTLEHRRRIDKIPGLPNLKTSTAKEYFNDLKETVKNTDQRVAEWDGELYLEYHRGTYTSHSYNKLMNRKMELFYREAEWLTAMAAMDQGSIAQADQKTLTTGWKILLTNQFHDIIPGSSINEVYEDCKIDYAKAEEIAVQVENKAMDYFIQPDAKSYTILNNSGWERSGQVEIALDADGIFADAQGSPLAAQKENGYWIVQIGSVPSMGWKTIYFQETEQEAKKTVFTMNGQEINTPYYQIALNDCGQITSIYDKENETEVLAKNQKGNVLQIFEDKPLGNDAWDIDIFYQEKMKEVTNLVSCEVVENGALRGIIRFEWKYDESLIRQDLMVYADSRRIDFKTYVDWKEKRQLLKAAFPVDIRSTYATYDVQYGNVRRPNHWNTSWDTARFETVAHKWVDLSEHDYGVSLLNDCKYGHDIKGNVIRITLLKSALHPDHSQDQGEHEFTYSLYPHAGDFVEAKTVLEAYSLNQPLRAIAGKNKQAARSFFTISNPNVELDAVKQSEDGNSLIVRFHEFTGSKQTVTITPDFAVFGWQEADLMERPLESIHNDSVITMKCKPYEIKTVLITL